MAQKPWVNELRNPPIQYQRGWTEFYKLKFKLTPAVLIPRPETELLVDEALKIVNSSSLIDNRKKQLTVSNSQLTVIDIGTGSGCIAISIAKNSPKTKVIATEISAEALEIAKQNAKLHHVENQIIFLQNDLIIGLKKAPQVMVANLPYIPTTRLQFIDPLVTEFEPKVALDGGNGGFVIYSKLFTQMNEQKFYPEVFIAEIDEEQGEVALEVSKKCFPNAKIEVKKDFYHSDRILIIKF